MCTLQDSVALVGRGHAVNVMFGQDGVFRSEYEAAGIGLEGPFPFVFDTHHPFKGLGSFVRPARLARAKKPDILWLNRFEHIFWAQAVARWAGCPIVCHLHHEPNFRHTSELSHGVAHFVAVSDYMRDVWVESGLKPERVSVIPNALPYEEYPRGGLSERAAAREQLGIPNDATVVLYYGRIARVKGVATLLDAWSKLESRHGRPLLVLAGPRSTVVDTELDRQLASVDPGTVQMFPMQSDVVPFLHAADLVVFPSWLEEGFGRVVIEGMATGRPVIASRVGAVPEILTGPMERFLVEPRSPDDLASRISSLLDWRQTEPSLESACADWVQLRYPFSEHVTALERVLLQHRRQGRGQRRG